MPTLPASLLSYFASKVGLSSTDREERETGMGQPRNRSPEQLWSRHPYRRTKAADHVDPLPAAQPIGDSGSAEELSMRIKHKLFNDDEGNAHVVWIIVDRETANGRPSLLEQLAQEPESGFTRVSDGVYYKRYL
jgi:hypothetical protein